MKREVALRGGLEKAREREEGVMAERRRQREDAAAVRMEELRGWIVGGGGGGRRGEEAVESDEKRVRCFGLPRRRGEEAHLARRRWSGRRGGDGNGSIQGGSDMPQVTMGQRPCLDTLARLDVSISSVSLALTLEVFGC